MELLRRVKWKKRSGLRTESGGTLPFRDQGGDKQQAKESDE